MTPVQQRALAFIGGYISIQGFSPTYDEIKDALGIASKSGVCRLVKALERLGKLRRTPNAYRSLEVVERPRRSTPDSAVLAGRLAAALMIAHRCEEGEDDEAPIMVATEAELRTTLLAALGG